MLDLLMLLLLGTAFGGAAAYVWACVELTQVPDPGRDKTL